MRRVVKVGGSLLTRPALGREIEGWVRNQEPAENLFLIGGGDLINTVRHWDALHPSDPVEVHWRCIDLLRFTFQFASERFSDLQVIRDKAELNTLMEKPCLENLDYLVAVDAFYRRDPIPFAIGEVGLELPESWATTTDAIAGLLGLITSADEVVLLKSCGIVTQDIFELANQEIVDPVLPTFADRIKCIRVEKLPELGSESS